MRHLCIDKCSYNSGSRILSYTMFTVTWCCSECCVPSGLNFKAAGDSIVRDLSNYLLRGHRVTVNMTWVLFRDKTQKHSTLLGRHVKCSTHGCSFMKLQYITTILLQFPLLLRTVTLLQSTASHLGCYCPLTAPGIQCQ